MVCQCGRCAGRVRASRAKTYAWKSNSGISTRSASRSSNRLSESPKNWADHGDAVLQKVEWLDKNTRKEKWIERTAENHLWQVRTEGQQEPEGFLGVYVDDLIVFGEDELVNEVMEQLMMVFKMAEPTRVYLSAAMRLVWTRSSTTRSRRRSMWKICSTSCKEQKLNHCPR